MNKILIALFASLWITPVFADGLTDLNDEERQNFRAEIRAYLLENPEVLMEAIAVLEQRQQQEQTSTDGALVAANLSEIENDGYSYVGGNPEGDITLVEFQDYRCGYCRKAHSEVAELVNSDGNIRLVVKEFPILGEQSTLSSRLAIATLLLEGDEAYQNISEFLIGFSGTLSVKTMRGVLAKQGYDANPIIAYLNDDAVSQHIDATRALANKLKVSGTPTFVLGGELVRGYIPLENMREMVAFLREANQ